VGVIIKSERQIAGLRKAGRLVAETYEVLSEHVAPGVTTGELDRIAETYIRGRGAIPIYKGYNGLPERGGASRNAAFPASICVAVNDVVCHGIPNHKVRLQDGDIVGIDIGVILDGWVGDACVTYAVGVVDVQSRKLLQTTERCLELGIDQARAGKHLGDIGAAIQRHAEEQGFSVVHEYVGHGVGRMLHEEPNVSHRGTPGAGIELRPGMVFTIEPMLNVGVAETMKLRDGWTVCTLDGKRSAQFEHTVAITSNGPDILTVL
jgi:methionyl aminopeptidase